MSVALRGIATPCIPNIVPLIFVHKTDTAKLLPVLQVKGIRYHGFYTGSKISFIDSSLINQYQQNSLATILSNHSQIFIKSYGPGLLATPGFRGGNASQTAVLWNGFNLQNPFTGQNDLSLIPAFLLDGIAIQYGSPATLFGSGNIGGSIHLQTGKPLKEGIETEYLLGTASFGSYLGGFKFSLKRKRLELQQKIYIQENENNFSFYPVSLLQPQFSQVGNNINFQAKAINAAQNTWAWLQDFNYTLGKNQGLKINTWLQKNQRNIPPALHATNLLAKQNDQTAKAVFEYQYTKQRYEFQFRYAYLFDQIQYQDLNTPSSNSISHNQIAYLDQFWRTDKFQGQLSCMIQETRAELNSASAPWFQDRFALFATLKKDFFEKKWQQQISGRLEWVNGKLIPFIPSYGFNLKLPKNFYVSGNASGSYRLPTFNDLYWPGMGNSLLQPEYGWNQEISFSFRSRWIPTTLRGNLSNKQIWFIAELSGFNKNIRNWILWIPAGGNLSKPMNLYHVWSRGLELDWKIIYKIPGSQISINGLHDLTFASNSQSALQNDASLNKQLIYTPRIKHLLQTSWQIKKIAFSYSFHYIGTRFVTSDHSSWLNPYQYSTLSLSRTFNFYKKVWWIQILAQNLFRENYQVMVNQPMPLYNYQITLKLKI